MASALQTETEDEAKSLADEFRDVVREELAIIAAQQRLESYRKHLTPEELAAYLGVDVKWIYSHVGSKTKDKIPHYKLGKYVRFDVDGEDFKAWLKSHKQGGHIDNNRSAS